MKHHLPSAVITAFFAGVFTIVTGSLLLVISYGVAAPTQAPPNGNPSFPLTGPTGPAGANGPQGAQGQTGPAGTWAPNRCEMCVQICDWNGAGPCAQTCAIEGNGWSSGTILPGTVDNNDRMRVSFDCW